MSHVVQHYIDLQRQSIDYQLERLLQSSYKWVMSCNTPSHESCRATLLQWVMSCNTPSHESCRATLLHMSHVVQHSFRRCQGARQDRRCKSHMNESCRTINKPCPRIHESCPSVHESRRSTLICSTLIQVQHSFRFNTHEFNTHVFNTHLFNTHSGSTHMCSTLMCSTPMSSTLIQVQHTCVQHSWVEHTYVQHSFVESRRWTNECWTWHESRRPTNECWVLLSAYSPRLCKSVFFTWTNHVFHVKEACI